MAQAGTGAPPPVAVPPAPTAPTAPAAGAATAAGANTTTAAPPPPRTYAEFYSLEATDPYNRSYAGLFTPFRCENSPPPSVYLFSSVGRANPDYPVAFLTLMEDGTDCVFQVVHVQD